jgi:hypothetical protein
VRIDVKARPEVSEDLRNLGSNLLRVEAVRFMLELREKPYLGQPLKHVRDIGDLSDCRKIYFDDARHRIVYRLLPNEMDPTRIDVISVGKRAAFEAYIEAVRRLGRTPVS